MASFLDAENRQVMQQRKKPHVYAPMGLLALGLLSIPFIGGDFFAYQIGLFLIYGIATQGVALCWGRLGFLPLGHALFFGLGAYLAGGSLKAATGNPTWFLGMFAALLIPTALAWVLAILVFSRSLRSGPYFSLITLALTMLGFLAAQQWSGITGGFNGLGDIPEIAGLDRYSTFYWLVASIAFIVTVFLSTMVKRPIGVIWSAIAQNEDRLQMFGYATAHIKATAFALSALLAALAGALFSAHQGIVTPQALGFVLSTEFVIWAAVGGKSSPMGALLGAVLVGYASAELRDLFSYWEVVVGATFIVVVRFLPQGMAGVWLNLFQKNEHMNIRNKLLAPPSKTPPQVPKLVFNDVQVAQGGVKILNGLSFSVTGPGIRSIIGPNGAGKTSTFNALTGRLPVHDGKIFLANIDVTGSNAWRIARLGVGRKMQIPSVFPELTVDQNLHVALWAGRLHGTQFTQNAPLDWSTALCNEMLAHFPSLKGQLHTPAGLLSQGHRQALEFVMTVLPEPHLLLLDEPCAGLSPAETHHMISVIQFAIHRLSAAALLIEHDISAVAALGGDVYVFHQGRLLAQGLLEEVQTNSEVRAVYAGARK